MRYLILLTLLTSCAHLDRIDPRAFKYEQLCLEEDYSACGECTKLTSVLPACWNGLGLEQFHKGEFDRALELFSMAIQADPNYPQAYNNMGSVFYKLGNIEQAIKMFDKALELDPLYQEALNNRQKAKGE